MITKQLDRWWASARKEIAGHKVVYAVLLVVLVAATFLRVYRIDQILGFYYDQGRDALVIWDLWHKGKLFLIGPTTGIEGIFRGPFYYYLVAPFYLLGGGNPVWPSIFLSLTTVVAIVFVYWLGAKIVDRSTGIIAAILTAFSFNLVIASRWLSNPTPMLVLSVILVWAMIKITEGKKWGWPIIALVSGLSLFHFGSSGEIFYFPALFIFAVWQTSPAGRPRTVWYRGRQGKNLPDRKNFILSVALFALTALPLIVFDLRHDGILRNNIAKFLVGEKSFDAPTWRFADDKIKFYYDVFTNKIFNSRYSQERILLGTVAFFFAFYLPKMLQSNGVKILLLLFISPIVGLIFFQGNFGNVYDYYLTGYYLIFIVLFAISLGFVWKSKLGKIFVLYFMYLFLTSNLDILKFKLGDKCTGELSICYINQKQAIDWVHKDSGGKEFNLDVYVPPVIPYAYDYLFLWQGNKKCGENLCGKVLDRQVPLLYTLYEVDPPHPERLEVWLARQKGIGVVEKETSFGGITVQRRHRI